MMAKGSNSGIYLQGRYEMQLLDSWSVKQPTPGDNGGIYERWDESRPEGQKGYQGYPPRQNASRAPGLWQHLEISFQAPRFDREGNKVENAKIIRARLNGVTIHEDVELLGPTRGAIGTDEVPQGPLRLQGDHGAVAFRNIKITRYDRSRPTVNDIEYSVYEGAFSEEPDFNTLSAIKSGSSELLTANLGQLPGQFLIQYSGTLQNDEAGDYTFNLDVTAGAGLMRIDGEEVIPIDKNEGEVKLPAGEVPFEILYARRPDYWTRPNLELSVSADGLRRHILSADRLGGGGNNPIYAKAKDKPLLRSFMDLPGERITHAVSVSSPDKLHYTYDLKTGNVVQVWRGNFLNTTPMWYNRGDGSSRPEGSVLNLLSNSALAVNKLEDRQAPWTNDTTGTGFEPNGYALDGNDNPTFKYAIYDTEVEDEIRVVSDGMGIKRTLRFRDAGDDIYLRLAVGESIQEAEDNRYLIDGQAYYLEVEAAGDAEPFIRSIEDQQELLIPAQPTVYYTILF